MAGPNTFGRRFSVTIIGESHGKLVGVVIDGVPAGIAVDAADIDREMARRRPGQGPLATRRAESDTVQILSGVLDGCTTGAPLLVVTFNEDADSTAYEALANIPRPGHADYPVSIKYGGHADPRGSGRFSGRLTAGLVMAGAIARQAISKAGIPVRVGAHVRSISHVTFDGPVSLDELPARVEANPVRCYDPVLAKEMASAVESAKKERDSVGGTIECIIDGIPAGIGDPFFESVESEIARLAFSVGGVKGIEFGAGFRGTRMRGSQHNDGYRLSPAGRVEITSNHAGGILGGITTGAPVVFTIAVKPTSSIGKSQHSVDLSKREEVSLEVKGRHDPCIAPRAVPVAEAIAWIVVLDFLLGAGRVPAVFP